MNSSRRVEKQHAHMRQINLFVERERTAALVLGAVVVMARLAAVAHVLEMP